MQILILDTNVAGFTPARELEGLAKRFTLRVSETALLERWVQSVRDYDDDRAQARGKFFNRLRSIAPFLDAVVPIAVGAGHLLRRVIAQADGLPPVQATEEREADLANQWKYIVTVGFNDEEWVTFARDHAGPHLDKLDAVLMGLARPAADLAKRVSPELQEMNKAFDALPDKEQQAHLLQHIVETLRLSPAAAERLDGHVRNFVVRLQAAARGRRMPKENDGADLSLMAHLGEGHVLLTDERQLVDVVDESDTYQAPWVRRLDDLDELPEGPPWGESAREAARAFRRRR